jgi:hypothetical protein
MFTKPRSLRPVVITAAVLACLLGMAIGVALVVHHATNSRPARSGSPSTSPGRRPPDANDVPTLAAASDAKSWDAIPPVTPQASSAFPPISAELRRDPSGYAGAFARELFSRDYTASNRTQLLGWAQYEDAPLRTPRYPRADWTKVLVNSLTDLTWDDATQTPIPSEGDWLALRSEGSEDTVADVRTMVDPIWEKKVSEGYQPNDSLTTVIDVRLTVIRRTSTGGRVTQSRISIAIALQLGSSPRGGYGVAASNEYVAKEG